MTITVEHERTPRIVFLLAESMHVPGLSLRVSAMEDGIYFTICHEEQMLADVTLEYDDTRDLGEALYKMGERG